MTISKIQLEEALHYFDTHKVDGAGVGVRHTIRTVLQDRLSEPQPSEALEAFDTLLDFVNDEVSGHATRSECVETIRTALQRNDVPQGWNTDLDDCPLGRHDYKTSHVIFLSRYGYAYSGYKIHDGTGEYAMHHPYYNHNGQDEQPVAWMPLPAAPKPTGE